MKILSTPDLLNLRRQTNLFDDFFNYVSTDIFTTVVSDSGTVAVTDEKDGVVTLTPSDGTVADNDEAYLRTTRELYRFADDKPLVFEARIQYAEAATNAANICLGVMDAVAADSILDNGAGPKNSYSGAVVFKVDGGTVWQCESSVGSSQVTTATTTTAGGAAYVTIRIEIEPVASTLAEVKFFINGSPFVDSNNKIVKHNLTMTSATEMHAFVGIKNGSATLETVKVDYIAVSQLR